MSHQSTCRHYRNEKGYTQAIMRGVYHIGEIGMTLTESGHRVDDQILFGIWSWGRWNPGAKSAGDDD